MSNAKLIEALQKITEIRWGCDGDCGALKITEDALDSVEDTPQKPVCPICHKQMTMVNFEGYYDEISYWECGCDHFPDGEKRYGAYC